MNENINIAEILKDAPKGTKLWSPLCGECSLYGVGMSSNAPISVVVKGDEDPTGRMLLFAANGKYFSRFASAECILFPSKDNRDWSTFKAHWRHKHFEPFQRVLVAVDYAKDESFDGKIWCADLYGHYDNKSHTHYLVGFSGMTDDEVIPFKGNEDKLGKSTE